MEKQQQQQRNDVVVVMVPAPQQGHVIPMLNLTRMIAIKGWLPVHFIGSATQNRQIKDRVQGWDPPTISNIHFHDFQIPELVTPPPDTHASSKFLQEALVVLLRALSCTYQRVVVVHDFGMYSAVAEQASLVSNVEVYSLNIFSAFAHLCLVWEAYADKPIDQGGDTIPGDLPSLFDGSNHEVMSRLAASKSQLGKFNVGEIYNTCEAIEGKFLAMIAQLQPNKKTWAMIPFNPIASPDSSTKGGSHHHQCLDWLDKHPKDSVIYVSFGATTSMSDEQIAEIATGLERSEQRFIWVLKETPLPIGFEERTKEVGIVIRGWAPQLQILTHSSTGGFMSNCGWTSCLESLSLGVPIAAWPMQEDQARHAMLVSEVFKAGLVVRDWARREELISSDIVESSVKKLMMSEEGDKLRKRADELGIAICGSTSQSGSSMSQFESFLTHISR